MASPRVLTITLQLHVPEGLRANIRGKRLETAVARIIGAVQGVVPGVSRGAAGIRPRSSWASQWFDDPEEIPLSAPAENPVAEPASPAEEAALTDGVDADRP